MTDPQQFLPLKAVIAHILLVLAEGDAHGYGIMQAVRERSGGAIQLETGPLYRHLHRLFSSGLVAEADQGARRKREDPRRRTYRLTPLGRRVLAAEARRMEELVEHSRRLKLIGHPQPA